HGDEQAWADRLAACREAALGPEGTRFYDEWLAATVTDPDSVALCVAALRKDYDRSLIELQVNGTLVREILEAMCRKQGISLESPFDPDEAARNYTLAQRLGIGHVFGISDTEEGHDAG